MVSYVTITTNSCLCELTCLHAEIYILSSFLCVFLLFFWRYFGFENEKKPEFKILITPTIDTFSEEIGA